MVMITNNNHASESKLIPKDDLKRILVTFFTIALKKYFVTTHPKWLIWLHSELGGTVTANLR